MIDIWSGLATFLAEMIEKYADQLNFDKPVPMIGYQKRKSSEMLYHVFMSYLEYICMNK